MKNSVTVRFTSGREEKFEMDFFGGAGAPAHAGSNLANLRPAKRIK